jgi:3-hydroxy-3-methylglutaryl CoA synthase
MSTRSPGDRVAHAQYGDGTVSSFNHYHTVIDFDAHGARTFVSPRVVLTHSTTPAPVKPVRRKAAARKKTE